MLLLLLLLLPVQGWTQNSAAHLSMHVFMPVLTVLVDAVSSAHAAHHWCAGIRLCVCVGLCACVSVCVRQRLHVHVCTGQCNLVKRCA